MSVVVDFAKKDDGLNAECPFSKCIWLEAALPSVSHVLTLCFLYRPWWQSSQTSYLRPLEAEFFCEGGRDPNSPS